MVDNLNSRRPDAGTRIGKRVAAAALAALLPSAAAAETSYRSQVHDFALVAVSQPLDNPWGLAFLPDGRMLVTERDGNLRTVAHDGATSPPLRGLPRIRSSGQGGLLDVALHPDFAANALVYLTHAWPVGAGFNTAVSRGRLGAGRIEGFETIFVARPGTLPRKHFGSRMVFGNDGKLYVTIGDRGRRSDAQDLSRHAGSVLRLNADGTVPADNPLVGRPDALPEIWSWGHRNQQGLAIDRATGRIWAHEHGPRGGDEVNLVERGVNHGWPVITYGRNYSGTIISKETARPGMAQPKLYWTPSIAPSGMAFYDGEKFPRWRGNLFVGALAGQILVRLTLKDTRVVAEERLLGDFDKRIRDVRTGPDGNLYLLTDELEEPIWRIEPRG